MSAPESYENFMRTAKPEWDRLRASGMSRKVRIDSVRKIGEKTWQVEFMTTDSADATTFTEQAAGSSQAWVSTYEVDFASMNVTYADRLNNPFGMIVVSANDARRDRSEEHTSELQSLMRISYAVFCLKKKNHTM